MSYSLTSFVKWTSSLRGWLTIISAFLNLIVSPQFPRALNISKHISPYNFILWLFIEGFVMWGFFRLFLGAVGGEVEFGGWFCLKVRMKTGKETACVLRDGPRTKVQESFWLRLSSFPDWYSTHNHLPWAFQKAESVTSEQIPHGQSSKVKCHISGDHVLTASGDVQT